MQTLAFVHVGPLSNTACYLSDDLCLMATSCSYDLFYYWRHVLAFLVKCIHVHYLPLLLLQMSGDNETNPGPTVKAQLSGILKIINMIEKNQIDVLSSLGRFRGLKRPSTKM